MDEEEDIVYCNTCGALMWYSEENGVYFCGTCDPDIIR